MHFLLLPHCSLVPPPPSPPLPALHGPPPHASPHPPTLVTSQIRPVVRFLREPKRGNQCIFCCSHTALWCPPPPSPPLPALHGPPPHASPHPSTLVTSQIRPVVRFLREPKKENSASFVAPTLLFGAPPPPSPPLPALHGPPPHASPHPPPLVTSQIRPVVHPRHPPVYPVYPRSKSIPAFPFLEGIRSTVSPPNGWNRCTLRCFRTALFPQIMPASRKSSGTGKKTLCLKHLQCRQTSPPPLLGGRRHGVSP